MDIPVKKRKNKTVLLTDNMMILYGLAGGGARGEEPACRRRD